jgi:hypothetical protein
VAWGRDQLDLRAQPEVSHHVASPTSDDGEDGDRGRSG